MVAWARRESAGELSERARPPPGFREVVDASGDHVILNGTTVPRPAAPWRDICLRTTAPPGARLVLLISRGPLPSAPSWTSRESLVRPGDFPCRLLNNTTTRASPADKRASAGGGDCARAPRPRPPDPTGHALSVPGRSPASKAATCHQTRPSTSTGLIPNGRPFPGIPFPGRTRGRLTTSPRLSLPITEAAEAGHLQAPAPDASSPLRLYRRILRSLSRHAALQLGAHQPVATTDRCSATCDPAAASSCGCCATSATAVSAHGRWPVTLPSRAVPHRAVDRGGAAGRRGRPADAGR